MVDPLVAVKVDGHGDDEDALEQIAQDEARRDGSHCANRQG
ncbi:MAG: hypothetical protein V4621_07450 [Pseudomonadota bacterium]